MLSDTEYINTIVDRVTKIATKAAMNGNPLANITWCPPANATCDKIGMFVLDYADVKTSDTPPWEKE